MLDSLYNNFKLPIQYLKESKTIVSNLDSDLELTKANVGSEISVYDSILNPQTIFGNQCIKPFSSYYTTNVQYLKDTQNLCKNIDSMPLEKGLLTNTWDNFNDIKNNNSFLETFQYIDWSYFKWVNNISLFLMILSFYNLASPVINLAAPMFALIVPFFLLKAMRIPVTMNSYYTILKEQLKKHAIGQLFTQWNSVNITKKGYLLFCFSMYFYNIYQNVLSCKKFYNNSTYITNTFNNFRGYLDYTIENMTYYQKLVCSYTTYNNFSNCLQNEKQKLITYYNDFVGLPNNFLSLKNIGYIGVTMKNFYIVYDDDDFKDSITYSFAFNGYIDVMKSISNKVNKKIINKVKLLTNKSSKLQFKQLYHPLLKNKPIKNDITLKKNKIITGPNASGKTTMLKSTIINLLLCQQIGFGFLDSGKITPFHHIHCYMNIPDTNGRDSLFQAEARRCLEIYENMNTHKDERHFAIFDELYSGTNPYEAISSAYAYLHCISKNKNIKFILTTHFIKLCELFQQKKNKRIENYHMSTTIINKYDPIYKYKITKGISKVKGGICVLKQLNYPQHIIENTQNTLNNI